MSWVTFDNLKRFFEGLKTKPLVFSGDINFNGTTKYKNNELATKTDLSSVSVTVDNKLSSSSVNPVQNKIIKDALDKKANLSDISNISGITESKLEGTGYVKFGNRLVAQWGKTGEIIFYDSDYATPRDLGNQVVALPVPVKSLFYVNFTYKETASSGRAYQVTACLKELATQSFTVSFSSSQDGGGPTKVQPYYFALGTT